MTKLSVKEPSKKKRKKTLTNASIKEALKEKHCCYVLITCSEPSVDGSMQVEMSFDGDECLASYLLESAQEVHFQKKRDQSIDSY